MQAFLKCDADGCDHCEDVPEITADMIGKPCPKCGANLLTEADYREGMRMKHFLEALEKLGVAGSTKPDAVPVSINPRAGEINIKIGQAAAHREPQSSAPDTAPLFDGSPLPYTPAPQPVLPPWGISPDGSTRIDPTKGRDNG